MLGRTTKQKDIYLYARERDVTQKQAKNRKSILRHQRGDSSRFDGGGRLGIGLDFKRLVGHFRRFNGGLLTTHPIHITYSLGQTCKPI